jgi:hypothetical protein
MGFRVECVLLQTVHSFLRLGLLMCRILDVIRMAAERKSEEKIRSALLAKVPKAYKDKTFKEKDFISDGKLSSMLKVWWSSFIFKLMLKEKDLQLYSIEMNVIN